MSIKAHIVFENLGLLGSCTERVSVENVVVIDVPYRRNCTLEIETQKDRILVFTVTGANVEYAQDFLTVNIEIQQKIIRINLKFSALDLRDE